MAKEDKAVLLLIVREAGLHSKSSWARVSQAAEQFTAKITHIYISSIILIA